jgi:hypothetical protein
LVLLLPAACAAPGPIGPAGGVASDAACESGYRSRRLHADLAHHAIRTRPVAGECVSLADGRPD